VTVYGQLAFSHQPLSGRFNASDFITFQEVEVSPSCYFMNIAEAGGWLWQD